MAKFFRGSVNQYLSEAMEGDGGITGTSVAQRGQIEIICAGSPCQSFCE